LGRTGERRRGEDFSLFVLHVTGIFNLLPLLQMTLLRMGLLEWFLRICHSPINEATKLPLSLTWHANFYLQRG
jgi:hypothetical protein